MVPIRVLHISYGYKKYNRGSGRKKEQMNNMLGLTQVQKGSYVTLCICRLTLTWISSENSTTLLECQPILTGLHSLVWTLSHADSSLCCPVSTGHSRHSSPTAFLDLLCPTLFSCSLTHFRSPEISSPKPFVWFRAKIDKGIVCLADHLHSVTPRNKTCFWAYLMVLIPKMTFVFYD